MSMQRAPGPLGLPIVGALPYLLGDRLQSMLSLQKRFGDIIRLRAAFRTSHLVCHPDHIQQVLTKNASNYAKGRTFEKTSTYLGNGLATSTGDVWRTQRRLMNPKFHRETLAQFVSLMTHTIDLHVDRWRGFAERGRAVEINREFGRLAMEVVAYTLFGLHVADEDVERAIDAIKVAIHHTMKRVVNPVDIPNWLPTIGNVRLRGALKALDEIVFRIIQEERKASEPSATLLSVLMHAPDPETGKTMSDTQLRDEVLTLFLGGTDTSGNTMSWVLFKLLTNPELYRAVQDEVDSADIADLRTFPFTRRVIDETLRLYPQNWLMARDTIDADEIGGYYIPAGTTVFLGVYAVHRHAEFWEKPNEFDPSRFEGAAPSHPFAYLPFGGGQRKCIGYNFALMEATLSLAILMRTFDFELKVPAANVKPVGSWSLASKRGIWVECSTRS